MGKRSAFEQHVAVFGESGSGKTTLISVFYGHQQAVSFSRTAGYSLLATDTTQGQKLLQTYHRIGDDLLPPPTRYRQSVFSFGIRPHGLRKDAGRLLWHDYPGEWWSETREGEEGERKKEALIEGRSEPIEIVFDDTEYLPKESINYSSEEEPESDSDDIDDLIEDEFDEEFDDKDTIKKIDSAIKVAEDDYEDFDEEN